MSEPGNMAELEKMPEPGNMAEQEKMPEPGNMAEPEKMAEPEREKHVMVIAIDDSDHSFYALEWTLDHFFVPAGDLSWFKLVIVHPKPSPSAAIGLTGAGPAAAAVDVMPYVDENLNKTASRVLERATEICSAKSVSDVTFEVQGGDPKHVLCDAVERYDAAMLVVGSHGYGTIRRALLGSVSDYCAHHAHCTVAIVKQPKVKN